MRFINVLLTYLLTYLIASLQGAVTWSPIQGRPHSS